MAEMNTSSGPAERWGIETPASGIEVGPSAIGRIAQGTREKMAGSVEGIDPKRQDVRAILQSSLTPVEERVMSVGGELGDELGDILPGRTENPGFIPAKLRALKPGIGEESVWPGINP